MIPLFDRVLVRKAETVTKTAGGIVIPEKAQSKVLKGTIVAAGPGSKNNASVPAHNSKYSQHKICRFLNFQTLTFQKGDLVPLSVKVGDTVLLPEYGGTKVELEKDKEFHLYRESDILAKLEF